MYVKQIVSNAENNIRSPESGGYHKEFYVCSAVRAARTRTAHLLLRMSPGHSRCASIASPAQRGSTHRFPRYCTATWKSKGDAKKEALRRISRLLKVAATYSPTKWRLPTLPQRSAVPSAMLSLAAALAPLPRPSAAPLSAPLSPAPARRRRAQPTPRMAHTAPHSATPPPMRHTRGGKRRLFLPGQKRYGLSQKRNIGLSIFITFLGGAVTDFLPIQWKDAPGLSFFRATAGRARV